jgi:hypothetical protein
VRRLYQHRDLDGGEEEGLWPAWCGQQAWRWHFGGRDNGLEVAEKSPGDTQASGGPARPAMRRFLARPLQGVLGADRIRVLARVYIRDERWQEDFLGLHLEAERFAQTQVCQEMRV